jgi:hypothetical protein
LVELTKKAGRSQTDTTEWTLGKMVPTSACDPSMPEKRKAKWHSDPPKLRVDIRRTAASLKGLSPQCQQKGAIGKINFDSDNDLFGELMDPIAFAAHVV